MAEQLLSIQVESVDELVRWEAHARDLPPVPVDYFPPIGGGNGYISLELLMVSAATCILTTLLTVLRARMKKTVRIKGVKTEALQSETHPKILKEINLSFTVCSADLSSEELDQALEAAETICPVWNMIKSSTRITLRPNLTV